MILERGPVEARADAPIGASPSADARSPRGGSLVLKARRFCAPVGDGTCRPRPLQIDPAVPLFAKVYTGHQGCRQSGRAVRKGGPLSVAADTASNGNGTRRATARRSRSQPGVHATATRGAREAGRRQISGAGRRWPGALRWREVTSRSHAAIKGTPRCRAGRAALALAWPTPVWGDG